jgi:Rrf2 family nitric oxide-sensitive transcriptional repressor
MDDLVAAAVSPFGRRQASKPRDASQMRLNRSTSHALRILIACAEAEGALVKTADLSEQLDITPQNVFKIVHILSHSGLVAAQRGRNGGVTLARPAAEIRIGDVVRAMEATALEIDSEGAGLATASDGDRVSGVNRVLDEALVAFTAVLDRNTLADMLGPRRRMSAPPKTGRRAAAATRQQAATKPRIEAPRARR